MLIGLHTCGDLAPSVLRAFAQLRNIKALCAVGCCYNLLSERCDCVGGHEGAEEKSESSDFGFPMTAHVAARVPGLGRNPLNLAANTNHHSCWGQGIQPEEVHNMYRSAFQVLWIRKLQELARPELRAEKVVVGKIAKRCSNFLEYVRKAQTRLQIPLETLSESEILECWDECVARLPEMRRVQALKALLARAIESLVLQDRLLYLLSTPGISEAVVMPLFDPEISPRSFAIVAIRETVLP